jgi:deoxyribodipyrimidine photolyase-related protein
VTAFRRALSSASAGHARGRRRWLFVPYDQLSDGVGPLSNESPRELGIVLVESPWKGSRRPYHKQKLALVLANLRHFALAQAGRGVAVRHLVHDGPYRDALAPLVEELGPLRVQRPAERELREDLAPLVRDGALEEVPHEGWLTTRALFDQAFPEGPPYRMDAFYRIVRKETGILMENGKPLGGKYSHDAANRQPWKGDPPAPAPPRFPRDEIKEEVADLVASRFADHPGAVDLDGLPATDDDAETLWSWAREECLPRFGPYEDAMSVRSTGLFHTRISPLLNLHRLLPRRVLDDVLALDLPLPSREGFVRQLLGWREFVRHVHDATDGFAGIPVPDGAGLPPAFWEGSPSGLFCLDRVVEDVWREGWSHHITRLMVLSNLATLLDLSPRELTDWFWTAYVDAYDWVVEPNVLGMGTYALGDLMTTKPYVSGAAYIDRMSDYCGSCRFHPKKSCPVTPLYWAYLARHREALRDNPRLFMPMNSLEKRPTAKRRGDATLFETAREVLARGGRLDDALLESA